MALILGLMFGGGLALVFDWLDYRLKSADEISLVLGLPILGIIPTMVTEKSLATNSRNAYLKARSFAIQVCRICGPLFANIAGDRKRVGVTDSGDIEKVKPALDVENITARGQKVHLSPRSVVAEAYRTIRTAVFFGVSKGKAKTIVITSPAPGDGKSTLASNLALAMAQAGQKTLILDADFRRPMQHNIFGIECKNGLSGVFSGTIGLDEAIHAGPIDDLDILPCGPDVPNPSEILNSETFAGILNEVAGRYDRVIIDSPPVAPVADSQILAAICDRTILVLRADKSTRKLSQQARDSLLSVGGCVLGVVVNDVPQKHGRYGRYGRYGHYGYYSGYGYYGHGYYGSGDSEKENAKEKQYV